MSKANEYKHPLLKIKIMHHSSFHLYHEDEYQNSQHGTLMTLIEWMTTDEY